MKIQIEIGDCFELIKNLEDNSVDLVITSPPYADIIQYGKNIDVKKPTEYVDWILPLFKEIYRVLKPSGSFILNINDNCNKGVRNTYIYELIYRVGKETKIKLYDTYIWHKKNGIPNGGNKRFRNNTEFIFHFVKDQKQLKFYMDRVLQEPADTYKKRMEKLTNVDRVVVDGMRIKNYKKVDAGLVRPDNVFRFNTAGTEKENNIKHTAPFNTELPTYFINLLTDEGDIVLDPFAGIMTSGVSSKKLNRDFIGFELNRFYAEYGEKRINGDIDDEMWVSQYDLEGNFIKQYKNRYEASKATGISDIDIMRTYNRTKFNSFGGFIWKLEPPIKSNITNTYL
ncbi:MAG: DNA-methyltransferase [Bacteroidota bacterium]